MPDLLVEIGTEEIPAGYLAGGVRALADAIAGALRDARIAAPEPTTLATPRRLAVHFADLPESGESVTERRTGPAAKIAFDAEGNPTKAALGFARGAGIDPSALEVVETDKGPYVSAVVTSEGRKTADVVADALAGALAATPFPKTMRWTGSPVSFARPVRNLVVLLGSEVVAAEAAGLVAGRTTRGHPFLAPELFELASADLAVYRDALRERFVVADAGERRERIVAGLAARIGKERAADAEPALLAEVVGLTEWPVVIEGRIDESFLALPLEVLEVSMRVHLRFFPVLDADGRPEGRFLAVMNRTEDSADVVREGNERVLAARLTDARFFFGEDRKARLEDRVDRLRDKALHRDLGSYLDKAERLASLVRRIAPGLGLGAAADDAARAARLAKADLVTEMVGEFPELQGTMGRIYARLDGEADAVAEAIEDHYRPRGPEDALPRGDAAVLLSIAEKLDNLAAFFRVSGAPTGSSDPFGLRRTAIGLLRISAEKDVPLPLGASVEAAVALVGADDPAKLRDEILAYLRERLYQALTDEGRRYDLVRAALAAGFDIVPDLRRRVATLEALAAEPFWPGLVEVVERTHNITRGAEVPAEIDPALLADDEEKALHAVLVERGPAVQTLLDAGDYDAAARAFADAFAGPVHAFFEKVFVNVDDAKLRANRMALLGRVNGLFAARVADLARVEKGSGG